jgi:hypothetical protein
MAQNLNLTEIVKKLVTDLNHTELIKFFEENAKSVADATTDNIRQNTICGITVFVNVGILGLFLSFKQNRIRVNNFIRKYEYGILFPTIGFFLATSFVVDLMIR